MDPLTISKTYKKYKESIKRTMDDVKTRRTAMRKYADQLYEYMADRELKEYEGIKITEVKPRPKSTRVTKEMKKKVILEYIEEHGEILQNPQEAVEIITSLFTKRNLAVEKKE